MCSWSCVGFWLCFPGLPSPVLALLLPCQSKDSGQHLPYSSKSIPNAWGPSVKEDGVFREGRGQKILSRAGKLCKEWMCSLGDQETDLRLKAAGSILEVSCELLQPCWGLLELLRPQG